MIFFNDKKVAWLLDEGVSSQSLISHPVIQLSSQALSLELALSMQTKDHSSFPIKTHVKAGTLNCALCFKGKIEAKALSIGLKT